MRSIRTLTKEELQDVVLESKGYTDCFRRLGYNNPGKGTSSKTLKKYISKFNIDTSHFLTASEQAVNKFKIPLENILVENSTYKNNQSLKKRLVKEGILEYKCSVCGNTGRWNNKKLVLQLEHINGKHNDNRLENLTLLCPNCHSQTPTYGVGNYK